MSRSVRRKKNTYHRKTMRRKRRKRTLRSKNYSRKKVRQTHKSTMRGGTGAIFVPLFKKTAVAEEWKEVLQILQSGKAYLFYEKDYDITLSWSLPEKAFFFRVRTS